jgi:SulP family sulfate permease
MAANPDPTSQADDWLIAACTALRRVFRAGYGLRDLRSDLLAGCVVGIVALPLSMALAIATGVAPQYGLYTAIVAGAIIAILGGSPVQVSGPTAAFVVILAPITNAYGMAGLLVATIMAGLMMMVLGFARLGRLIEFVPYPVTTGFTAGIALVIGTLQIRDLLGLEVGKLPDHFIERLWALIHALPTWHWTDTLVGLVTLAVILVTTRYSRRIPGALVAIPLGALLAFALPHVNPEWHAETIQSRFGGIPQTPPTFVIPWLLQDPMHEPLPLTWEAVQGLVLSAFAIAMLGAIESLLSAVVAAGMSGTEHDPDSELVAQGTGNIVAPFFGGFAATGALARTAANVRSGARSPLAAVFHAVFLLGAILVAAPLLGYVPMASMAALLVVVAWNMSEARHVVHTLHVAPFGDKLVLVLCLFLTVVFDMAVAVTVGVVLAALIFMQRMARLTGVQLVEEHHAALGPLPPHVLVYEISGPLFFGAAQRAMSILKRVDHNVSVVVLDLRSVPVLDHSGLVALESTLGKLHATHIYTIVAGLQSQPMALLSKAGWSNREWLSFYPSFEEGLSIAKTLGELLPPALRTPPVRRPG